MCCKAGKQGPTCQETETSVTDFFILPKFGRVHQCLDPTMPQKWSGPDPWTRWEVLLFTR